MTPIVLLSVASGVGVAGANGANDNAKGVARVGRRSRMSIGLAG